MKYLRWILRCHQCQTMTTTTKKKNGTILVCSRWEVKQSDARTDCPLHSASPPPHRRYPFVSLPTIKPPPSKTVLPPVSPLPTLARPLLDFHRHLSARTLHTCSTRPTECPPHLQLAICSLGVFVKSSIVPIDSTVCISPSHVEDGDGCGRGVVGRRTTTTQEKADGTTANEEGGDKW